MSENKIKLAVVGTGSCFSSFFQLIESDRKGLSLNGVMEEYIGKYRLSHIEVVAAFDVDETKVGKDIAEVIKTPNVSSVIHCVIDNKGVIVQPGPLCDGLDGKISNLISPCEESESMDFEKVTDTLINKDVDVVVCYLPTGSTKAAEGYAYASANANCAFINCTPEKIANNKTIAEYFKQKGLPLLGDDMRSHLGATTLHTALIELVQSRGLKVENTYQLNFGGNTDFYNLSDDSRAESKRETKKSALSAAGLAADDITAGPNGYIKYLNDTKLCFLNLECLSVLDSKVNIEVKLTVEDSPNSAGVMANAVRIAKASMDNGLSGVINDVCALLFKNPVIGMTESEGLHKFNEFINKTEEIYA